MTGECSRTRCSNWGKQHCKYVEQASTCMATRAGAAASHDNVKLHLKALHFFLVVRPNIGKLLLQFCHLATGAAAAVRAVAVLRLELVQLLRERAHLPLR